MCQATDPSKIMAFCAAVTKLDAGTDNFGDDQTHARIVAGHLGVRLVEVPTDADLIEALARHRLAARRANSRFRRRSTLMLAEAARDNGIKVLLSGVGGDDLFTGYGRHTAGLIWAMANGIPGCDRWAPACSACFRRQVFWGAGCSGSGCYWR